MKDRLIHCTPSLNSRQRGRHGRMPQARGYHHAVSELAVSEHRDLPPQRSPFLLSAISLPPCISPLPSLRPFSHLTPACMIVVATTTSGQIKGFVGNIDATAVVLQISQEPARLVHHTTVNAPRTAFATLDPSAQTDDHAPCPLKVVDLDTALLPWHSSGARNAMMTSTQAEPAQRQACFFRGARNSFDVTEPPSGYCSHNEVGPTSGKPPSMAMRSRKLPLTWRKPSRSHNSMRSASGRSYTWNSSRSTTTYQSSGFSAIAALVS